MSSQKLAALCQESQMRMIDSEKHTDAAGSLGIGLNMVKTVMQRHKGELRIESELGKGSTFTLILPVP
ncbi:hypothetical protein GCM10009007_01340 [Formosimonas limnophila]|uniref:histidine kinase n=1 Tax=Formosimonas limnophila TaxID=1384487 RepID=A0A8J3CM23_9BURK|nr:ATP-binding protein [Formosimonas limnophila]GHA64681.1 hypothetical protein GCM10009007_01340 [Formosimonas limnophila]